MLGLFNVEVTNHLSRMVILVNKADEDYSLKSIALNVVTAVFLWPITVLMLIFGFKEMMGKRQLRRRREELEAERIPQRETQ